MCSRSLSPSYIQHDDCNKSNDLFSDNDGGNEDANNGKEDNAESGKKKGDGDSGKEDNADTGKADEGDKEDEDSMSLLEPSAVPRTPTRQKSGARPNQGMKCPRTKYLNVS